MQLLGLMRGGWKAVALFLALAFPRASEAQPQVVSAMEDVFPRGALHGKPQAKLEAAAGEWEPFQIVVRGPLEHVRAEATALAGARTLPSPLLYRVGYLEVKTPSSIEGHPGLWPDPLIPDVDPIAHEKRRAFPFDVPAGEQRALWVDVFVPPGTPAGAYHGRVKLLWQGGAAEVPVELTVHRFELPRTSSLPVSFGISQAALDKGHGVNDPALLSRYALAALRDRISLHGGTFEPPLHGDFRAYDREVAPYLDGTADPGGPADGARWSAVDLRVAWKLPEPERDREVQALVDHLRKGGWLGRAFAYAMDEPSDAQLDEARRRAAELAKVAPEVPRLVTHAFTPALDGPVNLFCPIVNLVDDKPGNSKPIERSRYGKLWWYQACMSHGCDDAKVHAAGLDGYFRGWPSLVVDAPPVAQRIEEWLSWRYRISGELYYDTVEAYLTRDPWLDQRLFDGNGDGTLFYPGTPRAIGGTTQIPVESIRLKRIREGLEDYEYLHLHEQKFGREATDAIARPIARRTYDWEHDPAELAKARHRLAMDLDGAALRSAK